MLPGVPFRIAGQGNVLNSAYQCCFKSHGRSKAFWICGVAERVAEGKLSVKAAASCAHDFVEDGCQKVGGDKHCDCFPTLALTPHPKVQALMDVMLFESIPCPVGERKADCFFHRAGFVSMAEIAAGHLQSCCSYQNSRWPKL